MATPPPRFSVLMPARSSRRVYPITPATVSLMEAFKSFCQKYRIEPETGQNCFAILQAEDELLRPSAW